MTKLLFPPFIDRHVAQNVTEADWEQALNLWKSNLSILLKLPDHEFAKHLIENESLRTFIETFLKIRADFQELLILERTAKSTEMPLDKKVLLVLLRCSQPKLDIINLIQGKSLMDALYKLKFLSVPLLLDFLVNYGKSNFDHAREFFDNLILLVPSVIQDFESFSGIIIDHIKSLKQKIEEAKANNEVDLQNHALESYKKYILQMIDVAITLDCLFSISKVVASIYSNLPGSGEDQSLLKVVKSFYEFTLPSISNTMSPENTKEFARILNILKHALVSLIYHMIEASYFSPVGFTVEVGDNSIFKESDKKLTNHAQIQATLDRMNDVLFWIIEQSILEKPVLSFVDAPLILDLEIEFNLSAKLTRIKDEVLNGYPFGAKHKTLTF
ncbi:hypothetical protein G9A89_015863 [Geosiphon pyriformis]|nr:hypothetical protein G9A89_015863 [Geosiphon pyriformis]